MAINSRMDGILKLQEHLNSNVKSCNQRPVSLSVKFAEAGWITTSGRHSALEITYIGFPPPLFFFFLYFFFQFFFLNILSN